MTMASLTASLLARKGHAQPSASARDIFAPDLPAEKRWQAPVKKKTDVLGHSGQPVPQSDKADAHPKAAQEAANEQICSASQKASEQTPPRPLFAPAEARHTLVQTDEVVRPSKPAAKAAAVDTRKHKTLRLDEDMDMQLRLLAARKGTSQQSLMEEAVRELLKSETRGSNCICGSKK
ncbi:MULTISPECIES: ribbon-helix-helix domain-containing protein [Kordiimonas]|jgi:uncharacterized protein (DUF4415 family)|uniref:Ribbon-helix-helix protein, copG family n=1 Tax=Kordiimonas lacus TaxID=637679 RepID=A0A1G6T5C3_9PROT|nr:MULTISPECIES: ribbon-helix-helix domain-containing protein [Kordiimonas]SDD24153.1 Ribbon-helix-helix protein, copG family [Kordiimonas lacus]